MGLGCEIVWHQQQQRGGASQAAGGAGATLLCNRNPGFGSNGNDIIKAKIAQRVATYGGWAHTRRTLVSPIIPIRCV